MEEVSEVSNERELTAFGSRLTANKRHDKKNLNRLRQPGNADKCDLPKRSRDKRAKISVP